MSFSSWLRTWVRPAAAARRHTQPPPRRPAGFRLWLEALEDRSLPSGLPYPTVALRRYDVEALFGLLSDPLERRKGRQL
jgi:hypothetical protein